MSGTCVDDSKIYYQLYLEKLKLRNFENSNEKLNEIILHTGEIYNTLGLLLMDLISGEWKGGLIKFCSLKEKK